MLKSFKAVLLPVFVGAFYKKHGALLLFIFYMAFGLVPAGQLAGLHHTLVLGFLSNSLFFSAVLGLWILYSLQTNLTILTYLGNQEQLFLFYSLGAFDRIKRFLAFLVIQLLIYLPVLAYAVYTAVIAFGMHDYNGMLISLGVPSLLIIGAALTYELSFERGTARSRSLVFLSLTNSLPVSVFSIYLQKLINSQKTQFLLCKLISYLLISGIFWVFNDFKTDQRVAAMALTGIGLSHSILIFESYKFEKVFLSTFKNLPIARVNYFLQLLAFYCCLLLPETIWLLSRFQLATVTGLFLLSVSMLIFLHTLLYKLGADIERYLPRLLIFFVFIFWLMMYHLIYSLGLTIILISFINFYRYYYYQND